MRKVRVKMCSMPAPTQLKPSTEALAPNGRVIVWKHLTTRRIPDTDHSELPVIRPHGQVLVCCGDVPHAHDQLTACPIMVPPGTAQEAVQPLGLVVEQGGCMRTRIRSNLVDICRADSLCSAEGSVDP